MPTPRPTPRRSRSCTSEVLPRTARRPRRSQVRWLGEADERQLTSQWFIVESFWLQRLTVGSSCVHLTRGRWC